MGNHRIWGVPYFERNPCGEKCFSNALLKGSPVTFGMFGVQLFSVVRLVQNPRWEIQDPKMEVLYHIRPYFRGDIPLHGPYIGLTYGRYLQFRYLKWPLTKGTWKLVYQHSCNPLLLSWILGLAARIRSCFEVGLHSGAGAAGTVFLTELPSSNHSYISIYITIQNYTEYTLQ